MGEFVPGFILDYLRLS